MASTTRAILGNLLARSFRWQRFLYGRVHRRHHQRPLRRLRRLRAPGGHWWSADARWAPQGPPPREHNQITPLIDGDATFSAMYQAIRDAKSYVYVVGWALTPAFTINRAVSPLTDDCTLVSALAEAATRIPVKILIWSGSPFLFPPLRRTVIETRDELRELAPQIDLRLDNRALPSHCHHQKAIVVDGQIAFVGGLDLTTLDGDRWDRPGHPLRFGRGWHDVSLAIRGEAVADVEENFLQRWGDVTGERNLPREEPNLQPEWNVPCQVIRTVPRFTYRFAREGEFGIAYAYIQAINQAKRFIYIENQYLWLPEVVEALTAAMERNGEQFRVLVVLPARADMGKFDNDQQVAALRKADGEGRKFSAYCLYSGGPAPGLYGFGYRPVYVHSKVCIIDDEWYTVGSANLNGRGLATDTELNVQALDPQGARALRLTLWGEHLGMDPSELDPLDPLDVIDRLWPARALEVQQIVKRRRGFLPALVHPYETGFFHGGSLLQGFQSFLEGL
jgi:phosphatidylserine/phosphatidylglycerophosphate/cardiolipin synthase-like enzyme